VTLTGGWPRPSLRHLANLCDRNGLFEHARLDRPRWSHGYCTDDAGRALALACRLPADPHARPLAELTTRFLERAHQGGGRFRLRMRPNGTWTADRQSEDAAGRALLGLGVAAARAPWPEVRLRAQALFDAACGFRSLWPRATAYATLGAAEVLGAQPGHEGARCLLQDAVGQLPTRATSASWPWPEPRLTYANALLPEALLAAAEALERDGLGAAGLVMLEWLVEHESVESRFSFTPVGGCGPESFRPWFDQQPIESWAMADACARAWAYSGNKSWADAVRQAGSWFLGDNDRGVIMFDPVSGGGYDGLGPDGPNRNQGAESSLAFVGTMLQVALVNSRCQAARRALKSCDTEAVAAPTQRSAAP
jgi:hypothetical protein